jgi:hypothetical protein
MEQLSNKFFVKKNNKTPSEWFISWKRNHVLYWRKIKQIVVTETQWPCNIDQNLIFHDNKFNYSFWFCYCWFFLRIHNEDLSIEKVYNSPEEVICKTWTVMENQAERLWLSEWEQLV